MTGELGAVVGEEILGHPALGDQAIENLNDMLAAQPLADLDGETFAAEHINDRKSSELLPVADENIGLMQGGTYTLSESGLEMLVGDGDAPLLTM